MRRLIDRLLARWYVRRSLLDASIENTNMALRLIDEWKQIRPSDARLLSAVSRQLNLPFIIMTERERAKLCS